MVQVGDLVRYNNEAYKVGNIMEHPRGGMIYAAIYKDFKFVDWVSISDLFELNLYEVGDTFGKYSIVDIKCELGMIIYVCIDVFGVYKEFTGNEIKMIEKEETAMLENETEDGKKIKDWFVGKIGEMMFKDKFNIKKVIFSDPATIVIWEDDTKTVVKAGKNDKGKQEKYDPEKGLAMAICKKLFGTNESGSDYYEVFKKWLGE